eukprot:m51a1_g622 hypothetical protein (291) ;mRNA; r:120905-124247
MEADGAEDLRRRLLEKFRESGIENSLKAQLRMQLLRLFQSHPLPAPTEVVSLSLRLANSVVAGHMQRNNYGYSLSVFAAECGLSQAFTDEEVLSLMRVEPLTPLHAALSAPAADSAESVLSRLVQSVGRMSAPRRESSCQTDLAPGSLDEKLRSLDTQYGATSDTEMSRLLESRFVAYQKQCEENSQRELERQVEAFRQGEAARVRAEEQLSPSKERDRLEYEQRQKILEQMEQLKLKEIQTAARDGAKEQEPQTDHPEEAQPQGVDAYALLDAEGEPPKDALDALDDIR